MARGNLSERERRELANAHRGEVADAPSEAVEPKQLDQMVSLRLDTGVITTLREIANQRGTTMSELLREGASMVIIASQQRSPITDVSLRVVRVEQRATTTTGTSTHSSNPNWLNDQVSVTA